MSDKKRYVLVDEWYDSYSTFQEAVDTAKTFKVAGQAIFEVTQGWLVNGNGKVLASLDLTPTNEEVEKNG